MGWLPSEALPDTLKHLQLPQLLTAGGRADRHANDKLFAGEIETSSQRLWRLPEDSELLPSSHRNKTLASIVLELIVPGLPAKRRRARKRRAGSTFFILVSLEEHKAVTTN